MTEIINNWLHLYSTFLDSQSALHSKGGNLLIHHQCAASTWMMRRQPYCARMPTTHQLFCSSLFLLQKTWCCLLQGTTSPRSFEFFTHTNLSKRLLYVNAGSLASSCESQVFYIWDEDMTAASDEGKPSTQFFFCVQFYFGLKTWTCFALLTNKHIEHQVRCTCSYVYMYLSFFCYMFSVLCLGFLGHILSPVGFVVSL